MFKKSTFSRILFVSLQSIVCLSCVIGKKDGTKNIIAQFSFELRPRKKKDEQNYHIGVGALCANFNICDNGLSQT